MVPRQTDLPKQLELFTEPAVTRFPTEPVPVPDPPSATSIYWEKRGEAALIDAKARFLKVCLWFVVSIAGILFLACR